MSHQSPLPSKTAGEDEHDLHVDCMRVNVCQVPYGWEISMVENFVHFNFVQFKILSYLKISRLVISPSTDYNFHVITVTHEKREIIKTPRNFLPVAL